MSSLKCRICRCGNLTPCCVVGGAAVFTVIVGVGGAGIHLWLSGCLLCLGCSLLLEDGEKSSLSTAPITLSDSLSYSS